MGWLQLVVSLVQAVAWPLAVVVLVLVLRPHLLTLMERGHGRPFKRVKLGPVEAEWEARVQEGEKEIGRDVENNLASYNQSMPLRLRSLAKTSPRGAVLTAFAEVESLLRNLVLGSKSSDIRRTPSVLELSRLAAENNLISQTSARALDALRSLRNTAARRY